MLLVLVILLNLLYQIDVVLRNFIYLASILCCLRM